MEASLNVPLRVGVIGVGNWARHGHLRVLDLLPQYTLQAIYSHRREAAEAAAREYRIGRVAESIDELIEGPDIDLVVVLNTAPQHAQTVKRVIAANLLLIGCGWAAENGRAVFSLGAAIVIVAVLLVALASGR